MVSTYEVSSYHTGRSGNVAFFGSDNRPSGEGVRGSYKEGLALAPAVQQSVNISRGGTLATDNSRNDIDRSSKDADSENSGQNG